MNLQVLLEDGPLLAVNKPAGLLTMGLRADLGVPTLEALVRDWIRQKYSKPGNVYLGIPHRLDRPVSGVVVFGRNSKVAARLAEQFRDRQVRKTYWAIVEAAPDQSEGELVDWLLKRPDVAHVDVVPPETPQARRAVLSYRVLPAVLPDNQRLIEIDLQTGRMHQIRVQLASRGWPILGDVQYGASTPLAGIEVLDARQGVIALHARRLTLLHPIRYDAVTIEAVLPDWWPLIA